MPCTYTGTLLGDAKLDAQTARKATTRLARLLCKACERLDRAGMLPKKDPLRKWWVEHQQLDAQAARAKAKTSWADEVIRDLDALNKRLAKPTKKKTKARKGRGA